MARMSLDTAIRLSAEVKGGGNIDRVKREIQNLAKGTQLTRMDLVRLEVATRNYGRANDNTIAGIRSSIGAFRGLQEQVKIGSREFQRYGAEIQRLEEKLRGLEGPAKKAGESLGQQIATGLAAAGIGQALRGITMQAGRFDAELRKAAAIEGSAGAFGTLRKEIESVAAAAAGTPTEVAALATALSRAGFSAEETTQSLRGIVRGAEATAVSFEEMGSIAADNLRAFGLATTETNRVVDILTQTANKSNQTVLDVGESMKYAAPVARTLGVNMQDLASMIALMANAGIRGSDAGTGLRMGLFRLQTAAGGADEEVQSLTRGNIALQKAMGLLGAQILDTEGKLRPLDQVIIAMKNSFSKLSTTDQAILSRALFGTEAASKFLATMNFTEAEITKMFGQIRASGGVAVDTQQKMQGFDYSIKVLGGNVEYLTNQVGGMIGAALKPLIDIFNALVGWTMSWPEPLKQVSAALAAAGAATLGYVLALNTLKSALAVVGGIQGLTTTLGISTAATGVATAATKALSFAIAAMPWVALAAGVAAVTYGLYQATTAKERFRQGLETGKVSAEEGQKKLSELNSEIAMLQRQLDKESNGRMLNSLFNRLQRTRKEAELLSQSLQIAEYWERQGRASGGNPKPGEYYQPGVGYFDVKTGRFTRPDDQKATPPPPPATPPPAGSGGTTGGGGSGGKKNDFQPSSRARALMAAADKLGVSPLDLATIISFETGGTFSPSIMGGAGNKHMGLIQMGPNERKTYGARPDQSFEEQVTGPVVRFFQDRFGKVGMSTQGASLEDLYTTVLLGNPKENRNNRDSNGTSPRSGVQRMGPHRQKALSTFFGGSMANVEVDPLKRAESANQAYEQINQQRQAAEDLLKTEQNRLRVLEASDPLQRQVTEAIVKQSEIQDEYARKLAESKSPMETRALELARENALRVSSIELERSLTEASKAASDPLNEAIKSAADKLAFEREYGELITRGVNPELARQFVELDRIAAKSKENLELQIQMLEAKAAELPVTSEIRKELERQIELRRQQLKMIPGATDQAKKDIVQTGKAQADPRRKIGERVGQLRDELKQLVSLDRLVITSADNIGNAFGSAFRDLITGAASAREALAGFFKNVAASFAEMAAEIIAKQMTMIILQTILKALGAVAGAASGGTSNLGVDAQKIQFNPAAFSMPRLAANGAYFNEGVAAFANGGAFSNSIVSSPTMFRFADGGAMRTGLMGEAGPEAIMPLRRGPDGRLGVDASGLAVPFQRPTGAAAGAELEVPFQRTAAGLDVPFLKDGAAAAGSTAAGAATIDVRFETVRIGDLDVVTREEAQRIGRESAQRGAELAHKRYRNNPSARRAAGLA